jgi:16S rRNA (adenine1518-N6/adenine1519-N6)-dimethyltransferase
MKLSEMRQVLSAHGIQLTKSLGQHFLHDGNQLRRMVAAAEVGPGDRVLEIGPGLGPLTELLVAAAGQVLAVEKDLRLVALLRERFGAEARLRVWAADALEYLRMAEEDWSEWKLVANLPYCLASALLVELAGAQTCPRLVVVTVQLEVARRLLACPGVNDYGVLTLLVQARYEPAGWFRIPANCFFPAPEVESACVCLKRRAEPLLRPDQRVVFAQLVKKGFSQRRKMVHKLLKDDWAGEELATVLDRLRVPLQARAEKLTLEQYVALTRSLAP